ncbi:RNA polymerase sigma-70 factor, ECF subfamily [Saccharopolyspora shandongensis]|uniref:RNA polymerase sigma-70 factor, ECF subfamily n=1 Tax=Saccharopolyspora shandongensis TaxID=418495 RepID=A0A1H3MTR5_9PSEU|nr:sigma-70 family RNA polymerase sigma factor [Saccharopolyspora shandongensis]SDY79963.1 RNA polymerase sigma-70 factor, ECF subfamily [Saccharopolyspora shandongensis]
MTRLRAVSPEIAHDQASDETTPRHACANNAETALKNLYHDHYPRLLSYVTRILSDQHHAEDVVQETMLRAWRHADQFTPERGTVWGWLTRVAHNIAIDRIRARHARPTEVDEATPGTSHDHNADHSDSVIDAMLVAGMINKLVPAHRSVLYAVYFADSTAAGAAGALGIPVGTVKSRLHHALRNLKHELERQRTEPVARKAFPSPLDARPIAS